MKHYIRQIPLGIVATTLILLSSCLGTKDYVRPEVDTPDMFRFSEADTSYNTALEWWDLFDDPVLDTLIKTALERNSDLQATAYNVEAVRQQMAIQKADMFPQLNVSGQAMRGNFIGSVLPETTNSYLVAGQASWDLIFWGKYRKLNEAAKAQYLASEYGLISLRLSLITTVATTYFQLLEYREKQQIAESTFDIRDDSYQLIKQRFDAGIIPEIDLHHAQIQKSIAASAIPVYKRLAAYSENALCVLIGEAPDTIMTTQKLDAVHVVPDIPPGLPSDLLARRPDLLIAEQDLVAQYANVGVAQANCLPSISLTGTFGVASNELSSLSLSDPIWNFGGSLLAPIFNWSKNRNRVKAEQSRLQSAEENYRSVALYAFKEVEDVLIEISTLKEEQIALKEHVEAATGAMELSSERYDKGIASYIEYLESQRQAFDAQMNLVGNQQNILSAYAKLFQAVGGGWQ
ncbi:efflux transporter outer membrane subunit [Mangrovibacterium diazotrophicum]|uniref:Multidrug efflux system outer membrane protein n=1 Tax=Mangrovibacterium diazotrophicum TaxID=1261403 RepID=A0A419W9K7_9BACT|nr:efflux transporter outer membrane subunit [Mangrovibacterium diazotrophicum]RKD92140.1 multidrug efflux system outer membrane protein [Mangrovibacterium diazotrophicum]